MTEGSAAVYTIVGKGGILPYWRSWTYRRFLRSSEHRCHLRRRYHKPTISIKLQPIDSTFSSFDLLVWKCMCTHTHTHMRAHTYIAFVCMNTLGLLGNLLRVAQCSKQKSNSSTRLRKAVASKTQMTGIQRRNYSVKSGVVAIWCKVSNTQLESRVIRFAYR